ncbi:hypothetical protein GCM10022393_33460 [Aquimarina addita]|uniref:Peptidase S41 n=1 Tax=Aquimarina addita TaxID=870485 RepID=A0ABP6UPF9_9FLAO
MKFIKRVILLLIAGIFFTGCFEDNDDVLRVASSTEINDFIWKGMNTFYVYKSEVDDLANDRFSSDGEYNDFLQNFASPESIFDALRTKEVVSVAGENIPVDEFSFLVDDYVALEKLFDGITQNNGMEYGLKRYPEPNESLVFGFVRYVLPGTDADAKGIKRGDIFNTIDGIQITDENFSSLLAPDSYTIGLATYDGTNVIATETSVSLTKTEYTENPVHIAKTLDVGGNPVGYLMYNGFTGDFDEELNAAFGTFSADGVTDLILDLRYNGGGSVTTAIDLSSMITGQFKDQVFSTEQWNVDRQEQLGDTNLFDDKIRTGTGINSLNLTRVFILTTVSSASASELVINGLDPYIDVIQIGTNSRGKFQASITLYDSSDFGRSGADIGHTYAIQPLVLKSLNAVGFTDYYGGFTPDILIEEDYTNLGILGETTEPFLSAAIDNILGNKSFATYNQLSLETLGESKMYNDNFQRMYIDINEDK